MYQFDLFVRILEGEVRSIKRICVEIEIFVQCISEVQICGIGFCN